MQLFCFPGIRSDDLFVNDPLTDFCEFVMTVAWVRYLHFIAVKMAVWWGWDSMLRRFIQSWKVSGSIFGSFGSNLPKMFVKKISLWKMVKNNIKRCRRFFLHKINKNMQKYPGVKYFVNLWVLCRIQNSDLWTSLALGKRDYLVLSDPKLTLGN